MVRKLATAASLAWLAACAPATEETAQEGIGTPELPAPTATGTGTVRPLPAPGSAQPANAVAAAELPGEYRVAGVDGADINLPYGISASIREGRIHVVSDCVNLAWDYTYANGELETTRVPVESCARGLTREEEAIAAALESAEQAVRTPANGIELSGGGHSVTLFSQ